jgi:uncharacterized glyoxalase superfamily protein PhnB
MKRQKAPARSRTRKLTAPPPAAAPFGAVVSVRDIDEAARFYQRILGFELQFTLPRADGELDLAVLRSGASTLLIGRLDVLHYEHETRARLIRKGPHGLGITMTLLVPDVDKVFDAARKAGVQILLEPTDEFYGDRVFMFIDPDGYEWKISQTIRTVSLAEVKKVVSRS